MYENIRQPVQVCYANFKVLIDYALYFRPGTARRRHCAISYSVKICELLKTVRKQNHLDCSKSDGWRHRTRRSFIETIIVTTMYQGPCVSIYIYVPVWYGFNSAVQLSRPPSGAVLNIIVEYILCSMYLALREEHLLCWVPGPSTWYLYRVSLRPNILGVDPGLTGLVRWTLHPPAILVPWNLSKDVESAFFEFRIHVWNYRFWEVCSLHYSWVCHDFVDSTLSTLE